MRIPDIMLPHRVDLRPLDAITANGRVFKPAVCDVRAFVEDDEELVRDAHGNETVSDTKVTLDPEHEIPVGSMITIWKGTQSERTAKVVKISGRSNAALDYIAYRLV